MKHVLCVGALARIMPIIQRLYALILTSLHEFS
nr:MAG TPA: hypothetical protein [Caudoviricetes sp.]